MSITYEYLNGSKQSLHTYRQEACFYQANTYLSRHKKAVYFRYKLTNITVSNEMMRDYLTFLNSTKVLYRLNVEDIMNKKSYTFRITRQNSLKSFATLTAIRYLEEETKAVNFILKNKDVKTISKLKLLLLSAMYQMNGGHFLNRPPIRNEDFIKHKITKVKFIPDKKITSNGLHDYFSKYQSTWGIHNKQIEELCNHYKVKTIMMCYKDTTFCLGHCKTVSCHRNKKGIFYGDGPEEDWMPLSLAPFHLECTYYQPEKFNEDNKQINS